MWDFSFNLMGFGVGLNLIFIMGFYFRVLIGLFLFMGLFGGAIEEGLYPTSLVVGSGGGNKYYKVKVTKSIHCRKHGV